MRLAILTAIHGRHGLARLWLGHYAAIRAACPLDEVVLFAVVSPEDREPLAAALAAAGCRWVTCRNSPVAYKWQAGIEFIRAVWPAVAAVSVYGSDDLASIGYIRLCLSRLASGDVAFGPDRIHMVDAPTGRLRVWQGPHDSPSGKQPAGAGRCWPAAALDAMNWQLWPGPRDHGLDTLSHAATMNGGVRMEVLPLAATPEAVIVDVKSPGRNIHGFDKFVRWPLGTPGELAAVLARIGHTAEEIREAAARPQPAARQRESYVEL
jgi:hypothetical protein